MRPTFLLPFVLATILPLAGAQIGKGPKGAVAAKPVPAGLAARTSIPGGGFLGGTDACTTPVPIAGQGQFPFDNTTATTGTTGQIETLCYAFGTSGIDNDVWYCWTANANGCASLTTCNLAFGLDTKIAVYPGCGCPVDGTSLACNDDFCVGSLESTPRWAVTNGTTYTIQLGNYPGVVGGSGTFDISITPGACPVAPANDDCSTPDTISGQGSFAFDTSFATTGTQGQNETLCYAFGTSGIASDVWYCWTADCTGTATLSICGGSTVDTKVAVYPGCACPVDGTSLACNDDFCNLQSELTWQAGIGVTYTIQLGTFPGVTAGPGMFDLDITPCTGTGSAVCFGDGSGTPCPCGNESAPGSMAGCANGLGVGAQLSASGSSSIAADDLVLTSDGITNQPGLFFQGNNAINGGMGVLFGDGLRCCGQGVVRLEIIDPPGPTQPTTANTTVSIANHAPPGTVNPGDTKCYQHWYRNPGSSPCGTSFNLSNGFLVSWLP